MNTINILNGVTLASQEEVTGHTGNTTMHLTEEERTAWNSAAAIPDSSGTYTGNNTHAGVETFNGAVVLNGPVTSDALETGRMLAKVTAMGFNISRPADGRPVKVGGTGNPWGWWSKDKVVVQINFVPDERAVFEVGSCTFADFTAPPEDHYAYAHTIRQTGNAAGIYISLQIDSALRKFRVKYHSRLSNSAVAPGVLSVYEWDMPEEFYNVKMARLIYAYRHQYLDVYYVTPSGELKLIAATPASQGYAITEAQLLFHGNSEIYSAIAHVEDNKLRDWLGKQPLPYSRSKWVERNSNAPLSGIDLPSAGGSSSLTLNSGAGSAWTLVSKPDWLDAGAEHWENGAVVTVSAGAAEETRNGSLILATDGNHEAAGVKAYEKVVITQTVQA